MGSYVLRRLLHAVVVVIAVVILVFLAGRMIGDPASLLLGVYAQESRIEALRQSMGLDDPIHIQLARFLFKALQGYLLNKTGPSHPEVRLLEKVELLCPGY